MRTPPPSLLGALLPAALRARLLLLSLVAMVPLACSSGAGPGTATRLSGDTPAGTSPPGTRPSVRPSVGPAGTPTLPPAARPSGAAVTLAFGGDVHFEGASRSALSGGLADIAPLLSGADLAMVNLETAVTERGTPAPGKAFHFRAPASAFRALARAGVDVVTMANNHGLDFGQQGLQDSLAAASAARFPVVGIGRDADAAFAARVFTVKGQRIAVLGATQVLDDNLVGAWTAGPGKPGLASAKDEARLVEAVRRARQSADTVVVYLHWGRERTACPLPRQRSLALALVAAGADVVVGSHAHVLLGGGRLGGAYVDYGLGNFVFYAQGGTGAQSGVLTLTVRGRAVIAHRWSPATIFGGVPHPLTGSAASVAETSWEQLRRCTGLG